MKRTLIIFLSLFCANAFAQYECQDANLAPDKCSFYSRCVENKIPCGRDGYALGYGEYYCNRFKYTFKNYPNDFSPQAEAWRRSTAVCLQKKLNGSVAKLLNQSSASRTSQCKSIRKQAFAQHANCYTQKENSICFLPPRDLAAIFSHRIIDTEDLLFSFDAIRQMIQVRDICLIQLAGKTLHPSYKWWKDSGKKFFDYH